VRRSGFWRGPYPRAIEGDLTLLQSLLRTLRVAGEDTDSDGWRAMDFVVREAIRGSPNGQNILCDDPGLLRGVIEALVEVFEKDGKLIAFEPGEDAGSADAVAEACGPLLQQHVAGRMSERIVYGLELGHIDEQQRTFARVVGEDLTNLVEEESTIGQMGQLVVEGQLANPADRLFSVRDIACRAD
jgi:hypothetical protein